MPLPELQTNNADFGNTLLKIRTMQQQDEQNRILNQNRADTNTRENALMVYKKKREEAEAIKAEAESKKAWRENAGTRVASLAVQPDGDMLNNYKVMYEADKEKNEYGLLPLESYINDKREIDVKAVREYLNRTAGVFLGKPGTKTDQLIRNDKADLSKPNSIDNPYALKVTGMIGENGLFTPSAIEPAIDPFRKQAQEEKVQNANIKHQEGTLAVSKGNLAVSQGNLQLSKDEKKNPKSKRVAYRVLKPLKNAGEIMWYDTENPEDRKTMQQYGKYLVRDQAKDKPQVVLFNKTGVTTTDNKNMVYDPETDDFVEK